RIINSREASDRFLFDYRKTLGDLAIDDHYRLFRDNAHKHGLLIHPESGGPHAVPIDAQRCLGWDDAPMSEFWAWSWTHRIGDPNRFFVKQPASAAHTYGHNLVLAEGFTTIGPHWQSRIWNNLKPSFDKALCEGLNVLVWHAFVCSPESEGIPGQQYFAGTHLNPNVTWWNLSAPFFSYINRCQWMLQQGHFAADVLYYYGDHVPNFAQLKASDPAHVLPGYDYDVITAEALIERASVKDGKIVLPNGNNYRVLVLPDRDEISLSVLKKIRELVAAGATVIGPKPVQGETLGNEASTDGKVKTLADELWGGKVGAGRVIADKTAREVLLADGVPPDCEFLLTNVA
ncbi:MAG TPA: glycosyl hydrolase, partial [Candidatus Binatia bacterium]|nr:glycosyl hydrolase [Candidatus Binatia bacterium]